MKTFLCEYIHEEARKALASFSEIVDSWERLGEADALISRNLRLDAEVLGKAKKLRVIAVHGTGIDGVDLEAAKRQEIEVFAVPHRNARSVAELNVALMLAAARKFSRVEKYFEAGADMGDRAVLAELQGMELSGKTAAFLGFGEIAKQTASILKNGFGMKVTAWSRSLTKEKADGFGIRFAAEMAEAVADADFVLAGMALTDGTRGTIGSSILGAMKPEAYFINTARGALVDENALYELLVQKRIAGAALDVLTKEPAAESHPLYRLPNVLLTPHIGANTEEALYRVGMACVEGIKAYIYSSN